MSEVLMTSSAKSVIAPLSNERRTSTEGLSSTSKVSEETAKKVVLNTQQKLKNVFGRWVILPAITEDVGYRDLLDLIEGVSSDAREGFLGTFRVMEFPNLPSGSTKTFTLLDRETSIGQIKQQISHFTKVPAGSIKISFQSVRPLPDEATLTETVNCHGYGGENIWLNANNIKA